MKPIVMASLILIVIFIIGCILWVKSSFDFEAWIDEYADDSWD